MGIVVNFVYIYSVCFGLNEKSENVVINMFVSLELTTAEETKQRSGFR